MVEKGKRGEVGEVGQEAVDGMVYRSVEANGKIGFEIGFGCRVHLKM